MRRRAVMGCGWLCLFFWGIPVQLDAQDRWDRALQAIERLPPSAFTDAPEPVRARLAKEGCRIPQAWRPSEPHNIIRGHFASPDQEDWAALCSRSDTSAVLIVWGGPARCPSEVAAWPDRSRLQGMGAGRIVYSRAIRRVRPEQIRQPRTTVDNPPPVELVHDGIDDAFLGKASSVLYCHNGQWLRLPGSD